MDTPNHIKCMLFSTREPACIFWDSNITINNNNNRITLECVINDFLIFCWYQPEGIKIYIHLRTFCSFGNRNSIPKKRGKNEIRTWSKTKYVTASSFSLSCLSKSTAELNWTKEWIIVNRK